MEKKIIFVAEDQDHAEKLCRVLQVHHFDARHLQSIQMFGCLPDNEPLTAVLIDLDSTAISNIDIRNLKRANPGVPFLAISREPFHPNLQESMQSHFFACVSKPVDPDELIYLLNIALENGTSSNNSNNGKNNVYG